MEVKHKHSHSSKLWQLDAKMQSVVPGKGFGGAILAAQGVLPL